MRKKRNETKKETRKTEKLEKYRNEKEKGMRKRKE